MSCALRLAALASLKHRCGQNSVGDRLKKTEQHRTVILV